MSSNEQTAAQARVEYERHMGTELGSMYALLWQEVAWIHSKWAEYVVLFGTSPERVALLNEAAPSFCHLIQDALWEDVLLHIARLTDPATSIRKANLSLPALTALVDRAPTKTEVEARVKACVSSSSFARDWRNRHLAHRDLLLALESNAQPLAMASRLLVNHALEDLAAVMNCISQAYLDSTSFFDGGPEIGGALDLLYVVQEGVAARQERRGRFERGEVGPADLLALRREI